MHMADALLSPQVGVAMVAAGGVTLAASARKLAADPDDRKVPLMGVMGAFVFAAQMINFTIPGTGSSGHLGGGMLLMLLLGPYAAFITMASVLLVQALFFADGGILALGANLWNMGFYSCFVGWIIYRAIAGKGPGRARMSVAAVVATLIALELGAISVAVETVLSGRSELPFAQFGLLMVGIHFPIALVEGLVTVAVVNYVYRIRPELLAAAPPSSAPSYRPVLISFAAAAMLAGAVLAWFASSNPDGLEWSIGRTHGEEELAAPDSPIMAGLARLQAMTSFLPDYGFKEAPHEEGPPPEQEEEAWPNPSAGSSLSGLVGSALVLAMVMVMGLAMHRLRGRKNQETPPEAP